MVLDSGVLKEVVCFMVVLDDEDSYPYGSMIQVLPEKEFKAPTSIYPANRTLDASSEGTWIHRVYVFFVGCTVDMIVKLCYSQQ